MTHSRTGLELDGRVLRSCAQGMTGSGLAVESGAGPQSSKGRRDALPLRETSLPPLVWIVSCSGTTASTVPVGWPPP